MFIHFLCLCPLRLAIMLNFNISKGAFYRVALHCSRIPGCRFSPSEKKRKLELRLHLKGTQH